MKKQRFKTATLFMTLLSIVMVFTSCHYKYFDDYDGLMRVKVVVDYSRMDTVKVRPAIMKAVFYSVDGLYSPFYVSVKDSTYENLPVGRYKVFAFNDDSHVNIFTDIDSVNNVPSITTGLAKTSGLLLKDSLDNTKYYDWPDRTFAYSADCEITYKDGEQRITLYPSEVTRRVEITVDGLKNLGYVKNLRLSLDGVQHNYIPALWTQLNDYVSMAVNTDFEDNYTSIEGSLYVFGLSSKNHYLSLHVKGDGFNRLLRFDVTKQVVDQLPNTGTIYIHVNADYDAYDDFPEPVNPGGSGTSIGVDDWNNEDIDLEL